VSCLTWLSWALWAMGYPDQALQRSREALALAEELSHPFTLAFALGLAAAFHFLRREVSAAHHRAEAAIVVSSQRGFPLWGAVGKVFRGWALVQQEKSAEGLAEIREGIAFLRASGTRQPLPSWLLVFAEACAQSGQVEEGLNLLAEAQAEFADSGGGVGSAESYRLTGELLLQTGRGEIDAEACFYQAIEVARRQQAKSWELRATMSLCRLWQKQGRREEARARLAEIYNCFTDGFETPDLREAQAHLEALSS
jgi:adenylate cyclase